MGTWGVGSFENDPAMDWLNGIDERDATGNIGKAFDDVLTADDCVEAPEAQVGLAAAELLAALAGRGGGSLPQPALDVIGGHQSAVDSALIVRAVKTIERVTRDSELQQLWADSRRGSEWTAVVRNLRGRLLSRNT
jgi:hypothetical protein